MVRMSEGDRNREGERGGDTQMDRWGDTEIEIKTREGVERERMESDIVVRDKVNYDEKMQ